MEDNVWISGPTPTRDEAEVSSEDQEVASLASRSLETKDLDNIPPRPQSALAKLVAQKSEPERGYGIEMISEMIRGKSMPSLRLETPIFKL